MTRRRPNRYSNRKYCAFGLENGSKCFFSSKCVFVRLSRTATFVGRVSLSLCACTFLIKFFVSFDLYVFSEDTVSRHIYSERLMRIQFHAHSFQFGARALPPSDVAFVRSFWLLAANSFPRTFLIRSQLIRIEMMIFCMKDGCICLTSSNKTNATAAAAATFRLYFIFIFCFRLINLNGSERNLWSLAGRNADDYV